MKSKFFLLLFIIIIFPLYPETSEPNENGEEDHHWNNHEKPGSDTKMSYTTLFYGKAAYSFFTDGNITLGLDCALIERYPKEWEWIHVKHIIGLEYQYFFKNKESLLRLNYISTLFYFLGGGVNILYNINNNDIGIAPQIGLNNYFFYFFAINCYYRYNFILNNGNKNFHEFLLTLNIKGVY